MTTEFGNFICRKCNTKNVLPNPLMAEDDWDEPMIANQAARSSKLRTKIRGISIRSRITLVFIVLILVALSVVGLVASSKSRVALSEQAETHLLRSTRQKADEYGLVFDRIKDEALGIADFAALTFQRRNIKSDLGMGVLMPWTGSGYGNPKLKKQLHGDILSLQRIGMVIKSVVSKNPYLSLGYLGTEKGVTVFDDESIIGVIEKLEGFEVTGRPWYKEAKASGKTIWTKPYIDANTKKLVITCATPVYGAGNRLFGVVGFDVLLDTIQNDILNLNIGYDSYAFMVDQDGKALVHPAMAKKDARWNHSFNAKNLKATPNQAFNAIVGSMIGSQTGVSAYDSEDGAKYVSYAPLKAIKASVAIVASKDEVVRPAVVIQTLILIVWGVVLIVAIVAGFVVGNGITKPINELTRAADLISQGKMNLDVLPEDRKDEIGLLTQAFNRLVMSLKIAMMQKSAS